MITLSKECIEAIDFDINSKWDGYPHYKKLEVKDSMIKALTNPSIYTKANLIHQDKVQILLDALDRISYTMDSYTKKQITEALNKYNQSK